MPVADLNTNLSLVESELRKFITSHKGKTAEIDARLMVIEQSMVSRGGSPGPGSPGGIFGQKSIGDLVIESEAFTLFQKGGRSSGQISVGSFHKAASNIVSGPWTVGPEFLPRIAAPPMPTLPLRDLIPSFTTVSNLVEFARETATTDSAGYQGGEGITKAQSDLSFTLIAQPVCTLAHWMAASRQSLDDSPALSQYINTRIMYQLARFIEGELLFGDGTTGHLSGICPQASVLTGTTPGDLIAGIAEAASQLAGIGVVADAAVVNPSDFWAARQVKASTSGVFLAGDPLSPFPPSLWNLPLAQSVVMPQGKFLVGAFRAQSAIADRQMATVEISREHSDFFVGNLVAILCEERLALLVYRPEAFVVGHLTGYVGS